MQKGPGDGKQACSATYRVRGYSSNENIRERGSIEKQKKNKEGIGHLTEGDVQPVALVSTLLEHGDARRRVEGHDSNSERFTESSNSSFQSRWCVSTRYAGNAPGLAARVSEPRLPLEVSFDAAYALSSLIDAKYFSRC
mmetsp:Transcript_2915/g.9081  ORF Transcript_2915/g.9081 Transcript_2915/m.9081 type:complete len:139 (+) Transcript_2915:158-574(+)